MPRKLANSIAMLALCVQSVAADVELSGFVDMSILSDDGVVGMGLDQFELDLSTDLGDGISIRADVNAMGPTAPVELEQAYIAYEVGEGLSLTVGKFLSCTGFEANEPTGMYQYSTSATLVYGGYQNGVAASYATDKFGLYGAVVSSVWDGSEKDMIGKLEPEKGAVDAELKEDAIDSDFGIEAQLILTPIEGVTAKAAFAMEDKRNLINVWGLYENGPLSVAAEVNLISDWVNADGSFDSGLGYLAMVNYGLSDKIGVTARYSAIALTPAGGGKDDETNEITIAPSYAISDNWGLIAEAKLLTVGDADAVAQIGLESLITF